MRFDWSLINRRWPKKALAAGSWETSEEDIIQIVLADKPGALGSAAGKLGAAGINPKMQRFWPSLALIEDFVEGNL